MPIESYTVNLDIGAPGPQHEWAMSQGARCDVCQLRNMSRGPVPPTLPHGYTLLVVAEAPGHNEIERGQTLVGASGREIRQALTTAGADMSCVGYTNAACCAPLQEMKKHVQDCKRKKVPSALDCCRPRLQNELSQAEFAVLMGSASLDGAGVKGSILKLRGTPVQIPGGPRAVPIPHASFVMRDEGRLFRPIFHADVAKAVRISRGGDTWRDPAYFIPKTSAEVENFLAAQTDRTAADVETDGVDAWTCRLRRIGIGNNREVMIYSPLSVHGHEMLPKHEIVAQSRAIASYLQRAPRIDTHNGIAFDSILLWRNGMPLRDETTFDCYLDRETEFLTATGWRKYDQIKDNDELATFDETGRMLFQRPTGRVKKPRYGDVLVFEGLRTRSVVTPTHRMWVSRVFRGSQRPRKAWDFVLADDVVSEIPDQVDVRTAFNPVDTEDRVTGDFADCPIPDAEELIGLFLTDGNIIWNRNKRKVCLTPAGLCITQAVGGPASKRLHELAVLYGMKTYTYRRKDREKTYQMFQLRNHALGAWLLRACGRYSRYRRLPSGFLQLDALRRRRLFDGMLAGDSYRTGTSRVYSSASKRMRDEVHALALSLGIACVAGPASNGMNAVYLPEKVQQTARLFVRLHGASRRGGKRNCNVRRRHVDGHVVCFQVPSGRLVTRSRGKAAFHGNSLVAHQIGPTSELPHSLDFLASIYTDAPRWKDDVKHSTTRDDGVLDKYLSYDIATTWICAPYVQANVTNYQQEHIYTLDSELFRIGRSMSMLGLYVDQAKRFAFAAEYQTKAMQLQKEFVAAAGRDVNPNSPKQMQQLLYNDLGLQILEDHMTDSGDPSTDESTLLDLLSMGVDERAEKVIHAILGCREAEKILGTYTGHIVNGFLEGGPTIHADGCVRPTWRPGKRSGRWGSNDPNAQNIGKKLRAMYVAKPGNVLVAADMQAVELRMIAYLAGDEPLIEAFKAFDEKRGPDVHIFNACTVFKCTAEAVTDEIRTFIKRFVYAMNYDAEPPKIYQTLSLLRDDNLRPMFPHITLPEIERLHALWARLHPAVVEWKKKLIYGWRSRGYIGTRLGDRRRYFIGGEKPTEMPNHDVQGCSATMQNDSIKALVAQYPFDYANHRGLLVNGHDQLVVECAEREAPEVSRVVEQVMQRRLDRMLFPAAPKTGKNWKDVS